MNFAESLYESGLSLACIISSKPRQVSHGFEFLSKWFTQPHTQTQKLNVGFKNGIQILLNGEEALSLTLPDPFCP